MKIAMSVTLMLAGCASTGRVCPVPPPQVIQQPVEVYVPIDRKYTARCSWVADGSILDIFEVANGRKKCLRLYEANLDTIKQVEGKPAP